MSNPPDAEPTEETDAPSSALARWGRTLAEWGLTLLAIGAVWLGVGWLRAPDLPDQAPDFTLAALDGSTVTLSDLRGQTVVLNFWATWCGPCRVEIPAFSAFAQDHPEVPVLGIAVDGTPAELRQAAAKLGIDYPVLVADGAVQAAYQVETLPTTVVINPDGSVRTAHAGIMPGPQLRWAAR